MISPIQEPDVQQAENTLVPERPVTGALRSETVGFVNVGIGRGCLRIGTVNEFSSCKTALRQLASGRASAISASMTCAIRVHHGWLVQEFR